MQSFARKIIFPTFGMTIGYQYSRFLQMLIRTACRMDKVLFYANFPAIAATAAIVQNLLNCVFLKAF